MDFFWARGLKYLPSQFLRLLLLLVLFFTAQYSCWTILHILGFPDPSYSLGIFGPFYSLGHSRPISFSFFFTFPWALVKFFGLPWPNCHILFFWVYWPSNQFHLPIPLFGLLRFCFICFLSISHDSHVLATSFFGASLACLLSLELRCYFVGSWTIIPTIWAY